MRSFDDVAAKFRIVNPGEAAILSALRRAYEGPFGFQGRTRFAIALDAWFDDNPGEVITIDYFPDAGSANRDLRRVTLDTIPILSGGHKYITNNGLVVTASLESLLLHELGHIINPFELHRDNDDWQSLEGDNQIIVNTWYADLGIPQRASYNAYSTVPRQRS